ncbi:alpha/beta hydrolase [Caulobacter sp. CCUG 60055]|uniref:alpha/beta hydrolase n=1 Tax=Caulobacter sp. CCUG 60055 TaxID=2100090 RepID=UPI001FA7749C|nr:alpha/beta hydrolase [Caulobacter sp. CCUG 60055]MBQ1541788.1 alpha/beta hydrolase [Caulobacteraceae bacterium]MCI3181828.1 alpha/beta hydrolase [Caulobacter sp. CCUG 60055]
MADPAVQKFVLKGLLSLPTPLLRVLSGGGVVYQGGRTLDPRFQFMAAGAKRMPALAGMTPDEARAASAQGLAMTAGKLEPEVRTENLSIDGPRGPIRLRAYRPAEQNSAAPLLVYAHFGGGVIGDLETCDAFCSILAKDARCAVLSVDYRLAPEHRFPAGLEDVLAAYRWGRDNAARFGAPAGTAAIGGDSMGGNFAAVIAQELRRAGEAQPALQLLIYPAVDVASETQSMTTYADAYPLSRATMDWFMGHYMPTDASPTDVRLSPIKETDLSGLAPAVVVTAGFDPLVDQGEAYAKRLRDAGAPVAYRCYDSLAHGFTAFTGAVPCADVACREIAGLVREGLAGRLR